MGKKGKREGEGRRPSSLVADYAFRLKSATGDAAGRQTARRSCRCSIREPKHFLEDIIHAGTAHQPRLPGHQATFMHYYISPPLSRLRSEKLKHRNQSGLAVSASNCLVSFNITGCILRQSLTAIANTMQTRDNCMSP